jgi:alkaline phosphatase D
VFSGSWELFDEVPMRARLLPLLAFLLVATPAAAQPEQSPLTRIAFGSCADQELPQPIWDAVLAYRPELFIFAGDNVYGDVSSPELAELRRAYAMAASIVGYEWVRREVPHLATWDDHDYGRNDGGADFPHKAEAQALFLDFWKVPADDPRRRREGVHSSAIFGPEGQRVQVILLDTRYFRSPLKPTDQRDAPGRERYLPDEDPAKTMLGEAQWAWLEEELRKPAELRLVVSSIQVLAEGHGWERWGNLPRERQKLFNLVARTGAEGVLFLSGDRHVGGLYATRGAVPYGFTELTASGLNKSWLGPGDLPGNRLGASYGRENFGTVDIDWWGGTVALALRGMSGEKVREASVRLADLRRRD